MDSAALFNDFVLAAFWCALGIIAVALALAATLVALRIRVENRARRRDAIVERWRKIFLAEVPPPREPPGRRDAFTVLQLWNDFVRTDREGRIGELRRIAIACRLDDACGALLRGRRGARFVGLTFAGSMRVTAHLDLVRALREDPIGEVSLAAARAALLCGIETTDGFFEDVRRHDNWRVREVEELLVEIGYAPPAHRPEHPAGDRRAVARRPVGTLRADA